MLSPATENGLYTTKVGICFRNSRKRFCMYWCTYNLISPHANIILWAAQWKGHQPCPGSSSRSNIQAQLCRAWCIPWPYLTCTGQFPFFVFFFSFLPWKTLLTCTTRKSLKGKQCHKFQNLNSGTSKTWESDFSMSVSFIVRYNLSLVF